MFVLELGDEAERQSGRTGTVEVLRPLGWYAAFHAGKDGRGANWVWLDIKEWGLEGLARVVEVRPCPAIKAGPGRLVLMKSVTRYEGAMARVTVKERTTCSSTERSSAGNPEEAAHDELTNTSLLPITGHGTILALPAL